MSEEENGADFSLRRMVFDEYWKLSQDEHHFSELQSKYRGYFFQWLLATFAGMGWLLSTNDAYFPGDKELGVAAVALVGIMGVVNVWRIDALLYHPILDAIAIETLIWEKRYDFLPQYRANMITILPKDGAGKIQAKLYAHTIWILVSVIGACLGINFYGNEIFQRVLSVTIPVVSIVLGYCISAWMLRVPSNFSRRVQEVLTSRGIQLSIPTGTDRNG